MGSPIISITAKTVEGVYYHEPERLLEHFSPLVDLAVRSDEYSFVGESTVIDMTTDNFTILRHGAGIAKVLEFVEEMEEE
jgi:tRNA A37 threonylcarbamoyladenosine synthetase subunit TsaC/SUA5/YrdC